MSYTRVDPVCPHCGAENSMQEYGTTDYTQDIVYLYVDDNGEFRDVEWGDRDVGIDDVVAGYMCTECYKDAPKKQFLPVQGKVTPGTQGDDPAQARVQ